MLRHILTSLLFILSFAPATATPTTFAAAQNAAPAEDDPIKLLARPYGDSILLRFAPADFATWKTMQQNGVMIERRKGPSQPWQPVAAERLMAYSVDDFIGLTDTDNPHIVAVAEALHGEVLPQTGDAPTGPMARVKKQLEEQEQRYFLAVVNADLSAAAATALGWRFVDRNTVRGVPYTYRVRLLPAVGQATPPVLSNEVKLRPNETFPWGPVRLLEAEETEKKVILRWPKVPSRDRYIAYYLEVSDDGQQFRRMNEVPLIKTDAGPDSDFFEHTIELTTNYQPRYYRLIGINAFAERSAPGDAVVAQGVDSTPPPEPGNIRTRDNGLGGFALSWENPVWPADVEGVRIGRGRKANGPFEPIHADLLSPTTTSFTDDQAAKHQQYYYALMVSDTAGNQVVGRGSMAVWHDVDPPAQPVGLVGRIDTNGNVFLIWEPGKAPDLHGYRVFVSHARNDREYLQVTERILHENFFFDSTSLEVLNEDIYYQIVALDHNFNPSPRSEILTLRRPDKQPPAGPVISDFSAQGNAVSLRWRASETPDVLGHEVWRRSTKDNWRPLRRLGPRDTLFRDTTVSAKTTYTYQVRAVDEAGLYGISNPLSVRTGSVTARPSVINVARTQVTTPDSFGEQRGGDSKVVLTWTSPPTEVAGFQLYAGPAANSLRPSRRLPPDAFEWPLPDPEQYYALRVIYADGSRSPLSDISEPVKP